MSYAYRGPAIVQLQGGDGVEVHAHLVSVGDGWYGELWGEAVDWEVSTETALTVNIPDGGTGRLLITGTNLENIFGITRLARVTGVGDPPF